MERHSPCSVARAVPRVPALGISSARGPTPFFQFWWQQVISGPRLHPPDDLPQGDHASFVLRSASGITKSSPSFDVSLTTAALRILDPASIPISKGFTHENRPDVSRCYQRHCTVSVALLLITLPARSLMSTEKTAPLSSKVVGGVL